MTWIVLLLPLLVVVFIGAMLLLMPSVVASTLPLGVSIPRDHVNDPAIAVAVRRYRWGVGVAVVASIAATLALAGASPVLAVIVPLVLMLVLATAWYWFSRRLIQRAKRDGGWYDDVPVRLRAGISGPDSAPVPVPLGWYAGALAVLAAAAVFGTTAYAGLPDPMPVHWDASGVADAYAPKSAASVFGSLLIGAALIVLLGILAWLMRRAPMRASGVDLPGGRTAVQTAQRLLQSFLGRITLAMAVLFAGISVATWFHPEGGAAMPLVTVVFLVVVFALVAFLMLRMRVLTRATNASGRRPADAPDSDRYWKGGLIYVNHDDPALFVPKRFGVGWTVNAGHPAGMVIVAAVILLIVGIAVFVPGASGSGR